MPRSNKEIKILDFTKTTSQIAEIKNEWMRQWARTVLIVERSIPPGDRLRYQNSYCDIDTQGNKALVMKQYLSDEQVSRAILSYLLSTD